MDDQLKVWDELYANGWGSTVPPEHVVRFLSSFLEPGALLDLGCGNGAACGLAYHSGWYALGIDGCEAAVQFAKEYQFGIPFFHIEATDWPACIARELSIARFQPLWAAILDNFTLYTLEPKLAQDIINASAKALLPGGRMLSCWFTHSNDPVLTGGQRGRYREVTTPELVKMFSAFDDMKLDLLKWTKNDGDLVYECAIVEARVK